MKNNEYLLQELAKLRDIVNLKICLRLYPLCNEKLFSFLTPLEFSNFLNLKDTTAPVKILKRQNLRICYMVYCIANNISPLDHGKTWAEDFLKQCNIPHKYYSSHYCDVCNKYTSEDNKIFRKRMDSVFDIMSKGKTTP